MKTTRRKFLIDLAATAIALTADWAMTGVRVETPAPELEDWDRLEATVLRTQKSLEQLAVEMEQVAMALSAAVHWCRDGENIDLTSWKMPLDERTQVPIIHTGEAVPATIQVEVYRMPVDLEVSP